MGGARGGSRGLIVLPKDEAVGLNEGIELLYRVFFEVEDGRFRGEYWAIEVLGCGVERFGVSIRLAAAGVEE